MNPDLFRAILAMDAYNRGYDPGIAGLGQSPIGDATFAIDSTQTPATSAGQANSFYAVAYTWNNHQIISYRGTDNFLGDVAAWLGAGAANTAQAQLAAQFYQAVINNSSVSPFNTTTEFTGHSLGGGLAGLMGALYGKKAVVIDNMPFLFAADYVAAEGFQQYYFNGATPAPINISQVSGYFVEGEALQ
jgi:Lipase (class 3)